MNPEAIESFLKEERRFAPPTSFAAQANVRDPAIYEQAARDPEAFWVQQARTFSWIQPFTKGLEWNPPFARWFSDGKLNITVNCLDRHVAAGLGEKVAFYWEGEPGDERVLTYADLLAEVCRFANVLKRQGIRKGDRVTLYMGMVPELPVAMLACARLGAAHSVVFGGFSPDSLRERIKDSQSRLLITCDGGWRRGQVVALKANADAALEGSTTIEKTIVVRRVGDKTPIDMKRGRDLWWHDEMATAAPDFAPEAMDSEDLLYILYTSGTTGKPKGIAHSTAGYLVGTALTHRWVFDIKPDDIYWCTADIGWVTGHSYIVYGPLANATTSVMYEGAPDAPARDRFWDLIARRKVTVFYTAPTAIRTFMRWGDQLPAAHDLSSLRLLGSVGEPINPEAWVWYHRHIGGGRCPIVDTWWQTETGAIVISPLPGLTECRPGSAARPLPGFSADVVDEEGRSVPPGGGGFLVLTRPWPSMLRGVYGDPKRYEQVYWSRFKGLYFAGDGCKRDKDGHYWLLGRVDDIMLVAGHNISTMEVESALVDHPEVAESAVVGRSDAIKGQAIAAFVTLKGDVEPTPERGEILRKHVAKKLGPIGRPDAIYFTAELPKTRSGKIMRRLLRDIAEGRALGDTTTLADPSVVAELRARYEPHEA